jgi:hypothetical protein
MYTSLYEGLTQVSEVEYMTVDCKRVSQGESMPFKRQIKLNLPLFLTKEVWIRHNYSLSDVHTTLEFFSSLLLWQTAILNGIMTSNSTVKLAFSSPESMVYGSKAIVIRKLERMMDDIFDFPRKSVLDTERCLHVPPIPIHTIAKEEWQDMYNNLPSLTQNNLLVPIYVNKFFKWKDIMIVPMWLEKGAIYCVRIVTADVFNSSGRKDDAICRKPLYIIVHGKQYRGLEESCFFDSY